MQPVAPSGRQVELVHGRARVAVTEVGAGLREYRVGGRNVLDGYPVDAMASRGRGQLLAPWPNRIADGRYEFGGASYQLALNEVPLRNASHGLVRWSAWQLDQSAPDAVRASFVLRAQSGYPFTISFTADYRLAADGLTMTFTATNVGAEPAPVGLGLHPYFAVTGLGGDAELADEVTLTVPAATRLLTDDRMIPTGTAAVDVSPADGGSFDFRTARPIGDLALDTCYTDLRRDPDGRARVVLAVPGGDALTVWQDEAWGYLQVFTGDTFGPAQRRRSIAVEPLTCPANAFNSGAGLRVLAPGESFGGSWGISPAFD
ncbi:aldose 1-epimerase family protein [Frankia sp. R82]|uniref:aldose 1-epimerase family protein n=1 Tax=Frankia sp. R82 TaxID=2950553 RepID=UPI002043CF61|nr:aldose 1-epimerase family protein [Frankia sp. R82]MCM3883279.1 aldose 1-epimerase family protein [Frankia sp. R82]